MNPDALFGFVERYLGIGSSCEAESRCESSNPSNTLGGIYNAGRGKTMFKHQSVMLTNGNEFDQVVFILFITYQVVRS